MARGGVPESALLLTLLAAVITAARVAGFGSLCDTANCSKGNCTEVPGLIPSCQCNCDPGWSRAFRLIPFSPCTIPNCSFGSACFNLSLGTPPRGIPTTDICAAVNCGLGGECEKGNGFFSFRCACQPGFTNLLNDTALPCVGGNCTFGPDCAKLGLTNPPGSPAPSAAPAPIESGLQYY